MVNNLVGKRVLRENKLQKGLRNTSNRFPQTKLSRRNVVPVKTLIPNRRKTREIHDVPSLSKTLAKRRRRRDQLAISASHFLI
ncbi:hypothetical protein L596_009003 [Steinernema carpocapsae]|uniref:Uncharacterized protein n=1 Tax=Steinernema carpocapsae TaxID=34508 RepID=A0A4U5PE56_STECR|nr:hypothetical protein L596_009003 [Steinernema carpocapsae]